MRRLRTIILAAAGVAVLAAAVPAAAGAADHARRCTRDITVTHGNGWADADLDNTCSDPGWVWANFPAALHFTMFGPHHVAPPATDSDVGFGGDGWGTPPAAREAIMTQDRLTAGPAPGHSPLTACWSTAGWLRAWRRCCSSRACAPRPGTAATARPRCGQRCGWASWRSSFRRNTLGSNSACKYRRRT